MSTKIETALIRHLSGMASMPKIVWENTKFSPTVGTSFCLVDHLPAQTDITILGDGPEMRNGIFQVLIHTPAGVGTGPAGDLADRVVARFKKGTRLLEDGQDVTIRRSWRSPGITRETHFIVPVSIQYYGFVQV